MTGSEEVLVSHDDMERVAPIIAQGFEDMEKVAQVLGSQADEMIRVYEGSGTANGQRIYQDLQSAGQVVAEMLRALADDLGVTNMVAEEVDGDADAMLRGVEVAKISADASIAGAI